MTDTYEDLRYFKAALQAGHALLTQPAIKRDNPAYQYNELLGDIFDLCGKIRQEIVFFVPDTPQHHIRELDLNRRAHNILLRNGIITSQDIVKTLQLFGGGHFLSLRHFGTTSYNDMLTALLRHGHIEQSFYDEHR